MRIHVAFLLIVSALQLSISQTSFADAFGASDTTQPSDASAKSNVLSLESDSMEQRQLQTRKFEDLPEEKALSACAQVLQDLGFNIDNSEAKLGLIEGSKDREAVETGQVVGAILVAIVFGVAIPIDKNQKMFASLVISPAASSSNAQLVRVTFSRLVWDSHNNVSKAERLKEPAIYQEFFEKLSKSLFLEAQNI
jgi:hypothetical protein